MTICAASNCEIRPETLVLCPGCGRGYCTSCVDDFKNCENHCKGWGYCPKCMTRGAFDLNDEELFDLCIGCNAAMERANEAMAKARI